MLRERERERERENILRTHLLFVVFVYERFFVIADDSGSGRI